MAHDPKVGWTFPFVACRLNTTYNKTVHVLYDNIGDKKYWNGHAFLRIQFAFEMELISLFYKMYIYVYNIRPGLGLQCDCGVSW